MKTRELLNSFIWRSGRLKGSKIIGEREREQDLTLKQRDGHRKKSKTEQPDTSQWSVGLFKFVLRAVVSNRPSRPGQINLLPVQPKSIQQLANSHNPLNLCLWFREIVFRCILVRTRREEPGFIIRMHNRQPFTRIPPDTAHQVVTPQPAGRLLNTTPVGLILRLRIGDSTGDLTVCMAGIGRKEVDVRIAGSSVLTPGFGGLLEQGEVALRTDLPQNILITARERSGRAGQKSLDVCIVDLIELQAGSQSIAIRLFCVTGGKACMENLRLVELHFRVGDHIDRLIGLQKSVAQVGDVVIEVEPSEP